MGVQLTPSSLPRPLPPPLNCLLINNKGLRHVHTQRLLLSRVDHAPILSPLHRLVTPHTHSLFLSLLPYPLLPVPGASYTLSFSFSLSPSLLLTCSSGCTFAQRYLLRLQPHTPLQVKRQTWETKLGVGVWQWVGYRN